MKINISGFNISSQGMSVQRKKMNLIAENIGKSDTKSADGTPYKRKFLEVKFKDVEVLTGSTGSNPAGLTPTRQGHLSSGNSSVKYDTVYNIETEEKLDLTPGPMIYMPGDPSASEDGYVKSSNVNVITEMVDMIAASRNYEANLTAFNSSKQIAKDSMDI